ncbi:MAG: DegT/DnrJ/EryC1/StrS family aminotransferase [Bacteriovorax sp.]|nr:DegT/DnrJ/EryC1/StrS family aminotransferase [Bacteriovorax sp.]
MSNVFYPLATTSWDEAEYEAMQRVIKSGQFTMGQNVFEYEKDFARYLNTPYCVMVSSGSTANLIMIAALFYKKENPLKRGDEVIVPAVSWSTTYYPLYQYGLKLKFVDIDKETLNFNLEDLKTAVTDKTRAILTVNLLGNSNNFKVIKDIIGTKNIYLLEDNCESLGATFGGKQAGTFGVMGTFSSFFSHHISTMEGGIVCTDDEELHHILICLRAHGWTRNLPKFNHVVGEKSDDPFEESFRFVLPGYNVRPLEMSGAIGREQIKKLSEFVRWRRVNAAHFQEIFQGQDKYIIQKEIGDSSWFGYSFVINDQTNNLPRKKVVDQLSAQGVEVRPIVAGNFAKNEVMKWFDHEIHGNLKNADLIDKNGFFIGNHHYDMRKELDRVRLLMMSL